MDKVEKLHWEHIQHIQTKWLSSSLANHDNFGQGKGKLVYNSNYLVKPAVPKPGYTTGLRRTDSKRIIFTPLTGIALQTIMISMTNKSIKVDSEIQN